MKFSDIRKICILGAGNMGDQIAIQSHGSDRY